MDTDDKGTKRPIKDTLREKIRGSILSGEYASGARIVETDVAEQYGTSLAPVREALRELEALGYVASAPYAGVRVANIRLEDLLDSLPVRRSLEAVALDLLVEKADEFTFMRLDEMLDAMEIAAIEGDRRAAAKANADFHTLLVEAAGNAALSRAYSTVQWYSQVYLLTQGLSHRIRQDAARHRPIVDALRLRDIEGAHAALHAHNEAAVQTILLGYRGGVAPADGGIA